MGGHVEMMRWPERQGCPCRSGHLFKELLAHLLFWHRIKQRDEGTSWQARHVSGRHRSSREKWLSEDLVANCRNTNESETHCRRARLPSPGERHSAGLRAASSLFAGLLDGEM